MTGGGAVKVRYQVMRVQVMQALALITDTSLHTSQWFSTRGMVDGLDGVLHVLYDDMQILDDTASYLGTVLASSREVKLLQQIGEHFKVIDLSGQIDAERVRRSASWDQAVELSGVALAQMVINWGIEWPDQ